MYSEAHNKRACSFVLFRFFSAQLAIYHLINEKLNLALLYVTEETQFCVTAGSTLILKSVQSRELGQKRFIPCSFIVFY